MKPDKPLETLRNLGPQSCRWLREVGIHTISQLRQIGPVGAFQLVRRKSPRTSINLLWAIAAALADIDWRKLPADTKRQLRKDAELE
ncbi:MAG: TfoX/Sxy family DNA transformation protein [Planctomyces sp.]